MNVYERIAKLAKERKLPIKEVELGSGVAVGSIGKWRDSVPKADNLYKIALFFNVPLEYFLTDDVSNFPFVRLSDEEQELLNIFRNTTQRGRFEMIHAMLQVRDDIEKKQSEAV